MEGLTTNELERILSGVARAVEAVQDLPAVATQDWCDRAAAAAATLVEPAMCVIAIGTLTEAGDLVSNEVAGVGIRQTLSIAGRARPKPREEIGRRGEDDRLSILRVRAARLRRIGIRLTGDQRAQRLAARLDDLASRHEGFAKSDMPRIWHEIETGDSMLGLSPIGDPAGGRVMLVQIASTEPGRRFAPAEVQALAALLPALVRRTVLALGDERAEETRWLTIREQIVLDHLILGKSVRQIADDLERSPHTVHDHVKSLHRKLNASSRGELIARALGHAAADLGAAIHAEPKPLPLQAAAAIEPKPASERSAQPSED